MQIHHCHQDDAVKIVYKFNWPVYLWWAARTSQNFDTNFSAGDISQKVRWCWSQNSSDVLFLCDNLQSEQQTKWQKDSLLRLSGGPKEWWATFFDASVKSFLDVLVAAWEAFGRVTSTQSTLSDGTSLQREGSNCIYNVTRKSEEMCYYSSSLR